MGETLWQFTDTQAAPGVTGPCDCSTYPGTIDQFLAAIGDATNPQPQGAPAVTALRDLLPPGKLNAPIMCAKERPNHPGTGWRVAADGGVFPYGPPGQEPPMFGNPTNVTLAAPIVDLVVAENGYTLIGSDGGSFNYGPEAPVVASLA